MTSDTRCIQACLPGLPEAATRARRAVRSLEGFVDPESLDDVELIASELVGNSVRHALGDIPGADIDLTITASHELVRLEVVDPGPGFEPRPRQPNELSSAGRGLFLVDALSHRWGVERGRATKVWCELDLHVAAS